MRGDHDATAQRLADGEQDDWQVALRRQGELHPQGIGVSDRFEGQRDDAGLWLFERVRQVGRRGRDQFLAGGDRDGEAERAAAPQQRGEHRA